jgi:acyl-CoA thioesterase-2
MAFDLDDLLGCLELREVEPGAVEGRNLDIGYHRVFGGQILAQVLVAASAASPGKSVKSLHVLFPREGDTSMPMRYRVEPLQDGRTFGTTSVVATQGEKVIAAALVSMHGDEDGLRRSDPPPAVGPPEAAAAHDLPMVPWEARVVGGVDLAERSPGPPRLEWWTRAPGLGGEGDRTRHQALLAHATDLTLIGTALRPFEGVSQADSTVTLHTAVTSHTVWFHQPFRLDDWVLVVQHSPVVAHGRAYGRGDVFAGDDLVASFAQESMVRSLPPEPPTTPGS